MKQQFLLIMHGQIQYILLDSGGGGENIQLEM